MSTGKRLTTLRVKVPVLDTRCASALSAVERIKEYTQEHPLFGKLTGLYWWQPHVRGQNKEGIVMKDYAIKTKEAV